MRGWGRPACARLLNSGNWHRSRSATRVACVAGSGRKRVSQLSKWACQTIGRVPSARSRASDPVVAFQRPLSPSGSYGTVYHGTRRTDGAPVAIKTIDKARLAKSALFLEDTRREGQIMRLAHHPSIVRLYDIAEDASSVHFVEERCGIELFDYIVSTGSFSESNAASTFVSMLRALDHLHQLGIAHRDVKPENFLLGGSEGEPLAERVRLCDFGLACYALPGSTLTELVGSAPYVAPEVVLRSYSLSADVWSLGVVLYVMLSGLPAFWSASNSDGEIFAQILSGEVDLESDPWPSISADAKDLVSRLLTRDPASRPTAADALRHPWLLAQGASDRPLDAVVPRRLARFAGMSRLRRAALISAAGALPSTETAALRALFDQLDKNGDGELTQEELREGVLRLTDGCAEADDLDAAVAAVTRSARGERLSYSTFVAATHTAASLTRQSCLVRAFDAWDENHDGSLSLQEVQAAMESAGLSSEDVAPLFAQADTDGDGKLQLSEFLDMATSALVAEPLDDEGRRLAYEGERQRQAAALQRLVSEDGR